MQQWDEAQRKLQLSDVQIAVLQWCFEKYDTLHRKDRDTRIPHDWAATRREVFLLASFFRWNFIDTYMALTPALVEELKAKEAVLDSVCDKLGRRAEYEAFIQTMDYYAYPKGLDHRHIKLPLCDDGWGKDEWNASLELGCHMVKTMTRDAPLFVRLAKKELNLDLSSQPDWGLPMPPPLVGPEPLTSAGKFLLFDYFTNIATDMSWVGDILKDFDDNWNEEDELSPLMRKMHDRLKGVQVSVDSEGAWEDFHNLSKLTAIRYWTTEKK